MTVTPDRILVGPVRQYYAPSPGSKWRDLGETKALTGAPESDSKTGVMIALYPDPETAKRLAIDGGLAPDELHITVAYLGKTDQLDRAAVVAAARQAAAGDGDTIDGRYSGHARFTGGKDGDVLVALFDSPDLESVRRRVVDALDVAGIEFPRDHGYTAHTTLAYLEQDDEAPITRLEPIPATFDALAVVYGEYQHHIPLGGKPDASKDDGMNRPGRVGDMWDELLAETAGTKANPFGGGKGPDAGPKIATGAFVALGNKKGRVDLVVTSGTVPGAKLPSGEPCEGSKTAPAARVVLYEAAGNGTWKSTGEKIASSVAKLKRIPPLRTRETKSLDEALAGLLQDYADETSVLPDPRALRAVHGRGVASWPGETKTALNAEQWGVGRVEAFLATCAGMRPDGYRGDDDLLPAGIVPAELDLGI